MHSDFYRITNSVTFNFRNSSTSASTSENTCLKNFKQNSSSKPTIIINNDIIDNSRIQQVDIRIVNNNLEVNWYCNSLSNIIINDLIQIKIINYYTVSILNQHLIDFGFFIKSNFILQNNNYYYFVK